MRLHRDVGKIIFCTFRTSFSTYRSDSLVDARPILLLESWLEFPKEIWCHWLIRGSLIPQGMHSRSLLHKRAAAWNIPEQSADNFYQKIFQGPKSLSVPYVPAGYGNPDSRWAQRMSPNGCLRTKLLFGTPNTLVPR